MPFESNACCPRHVLNVPPPITFFQLNRTVPFNMTVFKVSGYSVVSSVVGRMGVELKHGGNILQRYNQMQDLTLKLSQEQI